MGLIQQTPTRIVEDPRQYLMMLYGDAGVGKTSFFSQIEDSYFLITEPGTKGVEVYGHMVPDWETFLVSCKEILKQKDEGWQGVRRIGTIIIDGLDALYASCGRWVCANETFIDKGIAHKFSKIQDVSFGKGYQRTAELIIEKLLKLQLEGFGVFVTAHAREKNIEWAGKDRVKVQPNFSDTSCETIVNQCDVVAWCTVDQKVQVNEKGEIIGAEQGRYMYFQPTFLRVAKHRLKGFPDVLPLKIDQGWATYCKAFDKAIAEEKARKELGKEVVCND